MELQAVAVLCLFYHCQAGIFGGEYDEHQSLEGYTGYETGHEEIHVSYFFFN